MAHLFFEFTPLYGLNSSRVEKYRQNSRKRSILSVFRAKLRPSEPKTTDKPAGNAPSCRYFARKKRNNYRQNSRKRSILSVFRTRAQEKIPTKQPETLHLAGISRQRREKIPVNHTDRPSMHVLECVANVMQATMRSAMYSASRTYCRDFERFRVLI